MMLHRIANDVWSYERDVGVPGGMSLPARTTVLRLSDGGLVLHSPLELDDDVATEIDALGEVRHLIAPNCYHWMFMKQAHARYPRARVFGPAGLARKLVGVPLSPLPRSGHIGEIAEELRVERIEGARALEEHVLLHVPSRSLLVGDLMFNVRSCRSFGMRLVLRVVGAYQRTAQSRMWRFLVEDRAAAARSAAIVLDLDFERVVVGHGDVVEDDAREQARRALSWMTSAMPPPLGAVGGERDPLASRS